MPNPKTFADKKTALETKRQQLAARIAQLDATERERQRKKETRQHFLVGKATIEHAKQNPDFARQLSGILNTTITRPEDRKVIAELLDTSGTATPTASQTETTPAIDATEKQTAK